MPYDIKITIWKGVKTFLMGGITAIIAILSDVVAVDPTTAGLVTISIALLTMALNYLGHRNDE